MNGRSNPAIATQGKTIDDPTADTAALDRMWNTNVHGVVANIRAAVKVLREGGRIITIGSDVATRVGFPTAADYAGTKAAIVGSSKGAARDLGPRNITVNVVQAGLMQTDMAAEAGVAEMLFSTLCFPRLPGSRKSPRPWCSWPAWQRHISLVQSSTPKETTEHENAIQQFSPGVSPR